MTQNSGTILPREREGMSRFSAVVPRLDVRTGGPGTPRLPGSSRTVSGILDRMVKPGDDLE